MESSLGSNQEPYIIGSLDDGIGQLPDHKKRIDELNQVTKKTQSDDNCINCPIASGCSYCTAYNYEVFGTVNKRATFICNNHKVGALATLYFNKLVNDKTEYDKIKIDYELVKDLIDEKEWSNLQWEG